ncbi:L,D-transpeptidase family protein [Hymenobacter negativus]|uniref:L,D-transpeptidase family protein n=1 Tax=Hymenobacter negativus TaxID=2795026 RepID=A0ABS3QF05_9BACT|nr:L,D-transpeptidase family protein [Hymenobacter negativus]MBO2009681.1 L,D-transpeptidase family protein [Hymenobacter negativus]
MQLIGCLSLAVVLVQAAADPPRKTDPLPTTAHSTSITWASPDTLPAALQALLNDTVASPSHRLVRWHDLRATRAFYARRAYAPAWPAGPDPHAPGQTALGLLLQAEDYGLQAANYHAPALRALAALLAQPDTNSARRLGRQARFEVLLTDGLVRFAQHLHQGQLRECTPSPLEKPNSLFDAGAWLTQALAAPDFSLALLRCQPQQREYQLLQQALARWLHQPATTKSQAWQRRAQQMAVTLERWRWHAIPMPDSDYVLVNLPAYALEVVRRGQAVQTQRLIIGKPDSPTPTLSSQLKAFTLTPEWRVPYSIASRELLPKLRDNPGFAAKNNYVIYNAKGEPIEARSVDWWDVRPERFPYTIKQKPGKGNALGTAIFRFTNPYEIFLHATSRPHDFALAYRALGHGCIRLEHPRRLATFLLGADSTQAALPPEGVAEAAPSPRRYALRRQVPLHVRYATCAVVAGQLHFYPDVYQQDELLRQQLFGSALVAKAPAPRPATLLLHQLAGGGQTVNFNQQGVHPSLPKP